MVRLSVFRLTCTRLPALLASFARALIDRCQGLEDRLPLPCVHDCTLWVTLDTLPSPFHLNNAHFTRLRTLTLQLSTAAVAAVAGASPYCTH